MSAVASHLAAAIGLGPPPGPPPAPTAASQEAAAAAMAAALSTMQAEPREEGGKAGDKRGRERSAEGGKAEKAPKIKKARGPNSGKLTAAAATALAEQVDEVDGVYECPSCATSFEARETLVGHMRVCTGGKWECEWCVRRPPPTSPPPPPPASPTGPTALGARHIPTLLPHPHPTCAPLAQLVG